MLPRISLIILFFFSMLQLISSAIIKPGICVTAIGIPTLEPTCLPVKGESINVAPPPKFLFSADNYCATYAGRFASLLVIPDKIPAGKTCSLTAYADPQCQGNSETMATSGGCVMISALPLKEVGGPISAKLSCS